MLEEIDEQIERRREELKKGLLAFKDDDDEEKVRGVYENLYQAKLKLYRARLQVYNEIKSLAKENNKEDNEAVRTFLDSAEKDLEAKASELMDWDEKVEGTIRQLNAVKDMFKEESK